LSLVSVVCFIGSGLCNKLITCSEESYQAHAYVRECVCYLETSRMRQPRPKLGCCTQKYKGIIHHHHHKHQGLDPLIRSVSRVKTAHANTSSNFQLFFPLVCSGMISKGFGFVAFFASVRASSVCIHLSCLVCL